MWDVCVIKSKERKCESCDRGQTINSNRILATICEQSRRDHNTLLVMVTREESSPILANQNDQLENDTDDRDENVASPEEEESWFGWLVVAASFLCNMVIDGMGYSFGVMLEPLMHEFHVGAGHVAFVGSILNGVVMLSAPLAAASINRYDTINNDYVLHSISFSTGLEAE